VSLPTQAVILVGGEGRRLRPLTDTRPKPMMPLVDRPFVAHQLDHLRRHGVADVVFSCGYRTEALEAHFGDGSGVGLRLRYVVDPEPLGTGGAIKNAEGALADERFLVLNGDVLTDVDLGAMGGQHGRTGAIGTLYLTPVDDPSRYGLVRLDADRRVERFLEKPSPDELRPDEPFLINAGVYLLEPAFLELVLAGRRCSVERETFPAVAAGGGLFGFPSDAYWRDIGTPQSYLDAHADVLLGRVLTESPTGDVWMGEGVVVEDGAAVGGLACIGPGVRVAPGARVTRSVVGEGAEIGDGVEIDAAIVGAWAHLEAECLLADGVVVGDGARVGARNRLRGPVRVATGATLPPEVLSD
jgi:mannose-1-phosphate guanylyltransferase